ncbi:hydroxyethylthiazole kinase [Alicyclobacillus sendaiensis]|uniref:Hydroxyethylthiazole kinase n=1 Tax=Alicyclobacillus sendaiensis PA2 TaxID=3029425 RepID=A0ABT6XW72_ALISE|nr:hydroxyethylthiazole kinase [Alicyclobacillus sendaiensis]MDI9259267.1 hydroxyethylthiazole kinase [Alicyclobacillus sendaiensis PA2]
MQIGHWLERVRAERPLVHNITNLVVTNIAANTLLALGASPVMAHAHEEVADMASIARAIALNLGTLDPYVVTSMDLASEAANRRGVPIVLDPVGAGATPYRTGAAMRLLDTRRVQVLRGNQGEIGVLTGAGGEVAGVDAKGAGAGLVDAMRRFARDRGLIVAATGEEDLVTDGEVVYELANGHPWEASITGSGCSLTAVIGAFVGVSDGTKGGLLEATVAAITCFNVAAEMAAEGAGGPGSFQVRLLDALHTLTARDVDARARIRRG